MKNKKVLVTGGAGFIGSHLVDRLILNGDDVFVIDDLSGGYIRNINENAHFYACDLRAANQTAAIIEQIKPQIVYHLAANAAENKSQYSPIDITSRNYNCFLNTLVPAIKFGMERIIVTSSIAVYGEGTPPFHENDIPMPIDLYGLSKLSIEHTLKILSSVHNFEFVVVRHHNVYGPSKNMADPYRNVVSLFLTSILNDQPYSIYDAGDQIRCFSFIKDVVAAIHYCGSMPIKKTIFNIGSDKAYSINTLSSFIQKVTKTKLLPKYLAERSHEVKFATVNHDLAREYLKYEDKTDLYSGIKETWKYARKLGPQKLIFTELELQNNSIRYTILNLCKKVLFGTLLYFQPICFFLIKPKLLCSF